MSKEQTDWVMVPRADAEDARDLLRLYGNNADWAALAARFDKHCAAPPEAQAVAWIDLSLDILPHKRGTTADPETAEYWRHNGGDSIQPLYLHPASPSPAGGVQAVAEERDEWRDHVLKQNANVAHNFARAEHAETVGKIRAKAFSDIMQFQPDASTGVDAYQQIAIHARSTIIEAQKQIAALSSQAQTTGGVE